MFDVPPRAFARRLFALPVWLYRLNAGFLLGERFLLLRHVGRKTGQLHSTVLEVLRHDKGAHRFIVASGWEKRCQWLRNIECHPEVAFVVRNRVFSGNAVRLSQSDAYVELASYAADHPLAASVIFRWLSAQPFHKVEMRALADRIPIIALKYAEP